MPPAAEKRSAVQLPPALARPVPDEVNILGPIQRKVIFTIFVLFVAAAVYRFSDATPQFLSVPTAATSLKLFLLLPVLGLLAFAQSKSSEDFHATLVLGAFMYGPFVAYVLWIQYPWLFVINAFLLTVMALISTWPDSKLGWIAAVLHTICALWILSTILTLLIELKVVPEYTLKTVLLSFGLDVGWLSEYLQFRLIFGTLYIAILLVASFRRALQETAPDLPRIPIPTKAASICKRVSLLDSISYPFLVVFDAFAATAWAFVNVVWLITAHIAVYVTRIGNAAAELIMDLILRRRLWVNLFRIAFAYSLVYGLCRSIDFISPSIQRYIATNSGFPKFYPVMVPDLENIGIFALLLTLGITAHFVVVFCFLDDKDLPTQLEMRNALHRQAFSSATAVLAYFCGSVVIYLASSFALIKASGYEHFGVLTISIGGLIILIAMFYIVSKWLE